MQTFCPYSNPLESGRCLDRQRLGKQRVECLQILQTLHSGSGWKNHPAVKMWRDYEPALIEYGKQICDAWVERGYKDTCKEKIEFFSKEKPIVWPNWIHDEKFLLSHRSNLIRKKPDFYQSLWPNVPNDLPYIWPLINSPSQK